MIDVAGGNKIYYYHDGLGSVVSLSDVNSKVDEIGFMEFKEYEIKGQVVNDFITECMNDGLSLMKKVIACRDYTATKKYTYYQEEGVVLDSVKKFYWAHTIDVPVVKFTREWMANKIIDFLNLDGNRIAVFEDLVVDSTDPCLELCYFTSTEKYYDGNELYYFVDKSCLSKELIKDTLHEHIHAGPFSNGVLTSLPDEVKITSGTQVSMETIELMATRAEHLFFGAFDSDGYILCSF